MRHSIQEHSERFASLLRQALGIPDSGDLQPKASLDQALLPRLDDHGVTPLLGFCLQDPALRRVFTPDFRQYLQESYRQTLLQNRLGLEALQRILQALESRGIEAILLKGAHLALAYYPDIGCRPMRDLDLLVAVDDLPGTRAALAQLGCRQTSFCTPEHQADTWLTPSGWQLDLHVEFLLFPEAGRAAFLETLQVSAQQQVRVFHPRALLTHLVVHSLGHRAESGDWFCWLLDVYLLLQHNPELTSTGPFREQLDDAAIAHWQRCLDVLRDTFGAVPGNRDRPEPTYRLTELLAVQNFLAHDMQSLRGRLRHRLARWGLRRDRGSTPLSAGELQVARHYLSRAVSE